MMTLVKPIGLNLKIAQNIPSQENRTSNAVELIELDFQFGLKLDWCN